MPDTLGWLALSLLLSLGHGVSNIGPELGAAGLGALRLIAVAPAEGRAVVSITPGRLELVAVDDVLGETGFRVLSILPDRLVLEQGGPRPTGLTAWLFVAEPGKSSSARYFSRRRPEPPALQAPPEPEGSDTARSLIALGSRSTGSGDGEGPK